MVTLDQMAFTRALYEAWQALETAVVKKFAHASKMERRTIEDGKGEQEHLDAKELDFDTQSQALAVSRSAIAVCVAKLYPLPQVGDEVSIKIEQWEEFLSGKVIEVMPKQNFMVRLTEDGLVKRARFGQMDRFRTIFKSRVDTFVAEAGGGGEEGKEGKEGAEGKAGEPDTSEGKSAGEGKSGGGEEKSGADGF
jgi:hypothetical protein